MCHCQYGVNDSRNVSFPPDVSHSVETKYFILYDNQQFLLPCISDCISVAGWLGKYSVY